MIPAPEGMMAQRFTAQGFTAQGFTLPDSSKYPSRRDGNIIFPPRGSKISTISPQAM
jgi:hypothetical protein